MGNLLWEPSEEVIEEANMTDFTEFVSDREGIEFDSYFDLHEWSVENIPSFWNLMWDYAEISASKKFDQVVDDLTEFPGANWFIGARMNFAENLLRYKDDRTAFVFRGETRKSEELSYSEVYEKVAGLAKSLRAEGIESGDRVCAYMPNIIETALAMLGTTSVGGTWASTGTELGDVAVRDRLGQIEPKVLFTVDGYY